MLNCLKSPRASGYEPVSNKGPFNELRLSVQLGNANRTRRLKEELHFLDPPSGNRLQAREITTNWRNLCANKPINKPGDLDLLLGAMAYVFEKKKGPSGKYQQFYAQYRALQDDESLNKGERQAKERLLYDECLKALIDEAFTGFHLNDTQFDSTMKAYTLTGLNHSKYKGDLWALRALWLGVNIVISIATLSKGGLIASWLALALGPLVLHACKLIHHYNTEDRNNIILGRTRDHKLEAILKLLFEEIVSNSSESSDELDDLHLYANLKFKDPIEDKPLLDKLRKDITSWGHAWIDSMALKICYWLNVAFFWGYYSIIEGIEDDPAEANKAIQFLMMASSWTCFGLGHMPYGMQAIEKHCKRQ